MLYILINNLYICGMKELKDKLMKELHDAFYKISMKNSNFESHNYITFLSYKYQEALNYGTTFKVIDPKLPDTIPGKDDISDPKNNNFKFNTYIGLNGDKNQLVFLPHDDIDNITIYVDTKNL